MVLRLKYYLVSSGCIRTAYKMYIGPYGLITDVNAENTLLLLLLKVQEIKNLWFLESGPQPALQDLVQQWR